MAANLTHALALAARGFRVFPVMPQTKRPAEGFLWTKWATTDEATIRSWYEGDYADHGVAVAGGNGLVILDADVKDGQPGLRSLELIEMMGAELGFLVATPSGGQHAYFRATDGRSTPSSVKQLAEFPGIDVRADGGYVVAPGTPGYDILADRPTPEAPTWLLDALRYTKKVRERNDGNPLIELDLPGNVDRGVEYLVRKAPEAIEGSGGNDTTFKVFCQLKDLGISREKALVLMHEHWNEEKASPPWSPEELETIAANAYAYGTGAPGKASALAEFDAVELDGVGEAETGSNRLFSGKILLSDLQGLPPRQWLYGHKVSRKYVTFIASPGGTGKTAMVFAMSLAAAAGKPLLHDTPRSPLRVWIYNLEDDMLELRRRLAAAVKHFGLDASALDNLRLNSGRDRRFRIVKINQNGGFIILPDYRLIIDEIRRERIDIVVIDPFLRSHGVPENENEAQDEVMRLYAQIAEETNCGIVLVHHTKKGAIAGDMDSLRGGSTQGGGARAALTLSAMGAEEAKTLGITEQQRRLYVRVDDAKNNMAPPMAAAEWIKLESVPLANGDANYPEGDHVQVATVWTPPDAFDKLTAEEAEEALFRIGQGLPDGERYSARSQDKDRWAGQVLVDDYFRTPNQAKSILATWVEAGLLEVRDYISNVQRKQRKGLFPPTAD